MKIPNELSVDACRRRMANNAEHLLNVPRVLDTAGSAGLWWISSVPFESASPASVTWLEQ